MPTLLMEQETLRSKEIDPEYWMSGESGTKVHSPWLWVTWTHEQQNWSWFPLALPLKQSSIKYCWMHEAINHHFMPTNSNLKLVEESKADKMKSEWTTQGKGGQEIVIIFLLPLKDLLYLAIKSKVNETNFVWVGRKSAAKLLLNHI